jgi:hypothetical protein
LDEGTEVKGRGLNVNSLFIAIATFVICYALKWLGGVVIESQTDVQKMNNTFTSLTEKVTDIKEQMKNFATKQDLEAAQKVLETKQLQFQIDSLNKQQQPTTTIRPIPGR